MNLPDKYFVASGCASNCHNLQTIALSREQMDPALINAVPVTCLLGPAAAKPYESRVCNCFVFSTEIATSTLVLGTRLPRLRQAPLRREKLGEYDSAAVTWILFPFFKETACLRSTITFSTFLHHVAHRH